jgi:hypothetical protein
MHDFCPTTQLVHAFVSNPYSFLAIGFYVQVEGNLRGATTVEMSEDLERLDRELLSLGSSSHSLSFSVASASNGAGACYDPLIYCLEWGALYTDTATSTNAGGNSFAIATSSNSLWLNAWCKAYAAAYSRACTFTKVDGDIKVETTNTNGYKDVSLYVYLKTATKTLAYASSSAVARSYVDAGAYSYTNVSAFCTAVKNKSPFCASGSAGTELTQVATASAKAVGAASSLAKSGSVTKQNLSVNARGRSLDYINGYLAAYAKSWAYANAQSIAKTYAEAFTLVANTSFASVCVAEHGKICGDSKNKGKGICGQTADVACASAYAVGSGFAVAASQAVAAAYVDAESTAEAKVYVSANLDCRGSPVLTWTHANAGHDNICH